MKPGGKNRRLKHHRYPWWHHHPGTRHQCHGWVGACTLASGREHKTFCASECVSVCVCVCVSVRESGRKIRCLAWSTRWFEVTWETGLFCVTWVPFAKTSTHTHKHTHTCTHTCTHTHTDIKQCIQSWCLRAVSFPLFLSSWHYQWLSRVKKAGY